MCNTLLLSSTIKRALYTLVTLLLAACSPGNGDALDATGRPVGETPPDTGTPSAGLKTIQDDVFTPQCVVCHAGAAAPLGLRLDSANAFSNLVGITSVQVPSLLRVNPGDPDNSYLIQKLEGTASVGNQMPLGGAPVSAELINTVREWIVSGALPGESNDDSVVIPRVITTVPEASMGAVSELNRIIVVFNTPMDFSLLNESTFTLLFAGIDGIFETADDLVIAPKSLSATNPQTVTAVFSDGSLENGAYQLTLAGTGGLILASLEGTPLDGDGDGEAGGDFMLALNVQSEAPAPLATWRWIQDNVFTPICTQCHIDGGIAAFLTLDETNSFANLINQSSGQDALLLLVNPGDADNSYLIQKVEGTALFGSQMPLNSAPLNENVIGAMRTWIASGALLAPDDPMPDQTPPVVSIATPNSELAGIVSISVAAVDTDMINEVRLLIDGTVVAFTDTTPYQFEIDTALYTNAVHTLSAEAEDAAGNIGLSEPVEVTIDNSPEPDTQAPVVSVLPVSNPVSGTTTITVAATDNGQIVSVSLLKDGALIATTDNEPYEFIVDTNQLTDGIHILSAEAVDVAGNNGVSSEVVLNVVNEPPTDNEAPQVSVSPFNSPVTGAFDIGVVASDNVGIVALDLLIDGQLRASDNLAPYTFSLDSTVFTDGLHTAQARASDAAGNTGTSAIIEFTIDNADSESPLLVIMPIVAPASGTITISIDATDNESVSLVELFIDAVSAGVVTDMPYEFVVDTTLLSDGNHQLVAVATDTAGNVGTSSEVTLVVDNAPASDVSPPMVTIAAPAGDLSGVQTIIVEATDETAVATVQLYLDSILVEELFTAPFQFTVDVSGLSDGTHLLSATATDTSANLGVATPLAIVVSNGTPQSTLPWIQENVFSASCASGCHSVGGIASFLLLSEGDSFAQLVNANTTLDGPEFRVLPFNSDDSSLMQRLEGTLSPSMPFGGALLPAETLTAVRNWIDVGAAEFPLDTIAPAVALSLPIQPASGTVSLSADAVDNVDVTIVRFLLDGIEVGSDTLPPYSVAFDTTTLIDGQHTIQAQAEDSSGNLGLSPTQILVISN